MKTLYIASTSPFAGKSLLATGLARVLRSDGRRVAYFKPYGESPVVVEGKAVDQDAIAMRECLELPQPLDVISPVVLTHDLRVRILRGETPDLEPAIDRALGEVSRGADVLIVGGAAHIHSGAVAGISGLALAKKHRWPVVLVEAYDADANELCIDCILGCKQALGEKLAGVILNRVRPEARPAVEETYVPFLEGKKIPVFGVVSADPVLESVTAEEIREATGGRFIAGAAQKDRLVRGLQVGAMTAEGALSYFRKKRDKAVITGGDRADIIACALETRTAALVLTGSFRPSENLLARAEDAGVPVIEVGLDTYTTIERLDAVIGKSRLKGPQKVAQAEAVVRGWIDVPRLLGAL